MRHIIKKLGLSFVLLIALSIAVHETTVLAVGDSGSKATIEFTEAWNPDEKPAPKPNPDPIKPPKKGLTLPQTGEMSTWKYSALGVLLIGTGAIVTIKMKRKEAF